MKDWLLAILFLIVFTFVVFAGTHWLAVKYCDHFGASVGLPSKQVSFVGCEVQVHGQWVPQDNWVVNQPN